MEFLPKELLLASYVLHNIDEPFVSGKPSPRQLPTEDVAVAVELNKKLKGCIDGETNMFLESDLDLSTAEKFLLLKFIERPWPVEDGEVYLSLKAKLS